jgi:hypothetical protein
MDHTGNAANQKSSAVSRVDFDAMLSIQKDSQATPTGTISAAAINEADDVE